MTRDLRCSAVTQHSSHQQPPQGVRIPLYAHREQCVHRAVFLHGRAPVLQDTRRNLGSSRRCRPANGDLANAILYFRRGPRVLRVLYRLRTLVHRDAFIQRLSRWHIARGRHMGPFRILRGAAGQMGQEFRVDRFVSVRFNGGSTLI